MIKVSCHHRGCDLSGYVGTAIHKCNTCQEWFCRRHMKVDECNMCHLSSEAEQERREVRELEEHSSCCGGCSQGRYIRHVSQHSGERIVWVESCAEDCAWVPEMSNHKMCRYIISVERDKLVVAKDSPPGSADDMTCVAKSLRDSAAVQNLVDIFAYGRKVLRTNRGKASASTMKLDIILEQSV